MDLTLILPDASMQVLDSYMNFVRPLLKPQCEFVLVTRNGGQHSKLGDVMSKLVFDAIGKFIHPTRYRQIVGTQSLNLLTSKEQQILSEDQNTVLRLQKFTIKSKDRAKLLSKLTSVYKSYKVRKARRWIGKCKRGLAAQLQVLQLKSKQQKQRARPLKKRISRPQTNCEFKENYRRVLKFTADEDDFLKKGIDRHGFVQWTAILRDPDLKFQDGRTADSLKKRAGMKMQL